MFGLLLEEMPGSETISWTQMPEEGDKQMAWKEQMAAHILFGKAFQACNKSHTTAFVSKFFGIKESATTPSFMCLPIKESSSSSSTIQEKKPVQSTLSSFMKYEFVVKNMQKIERTKKAAAKKALKEKEKEKETPKNEIILTI